MVLLVETIDRYNNIYSLLFNCTFGLCFGPRTVCDIPERDCLTLTSEAADAGRGTCGRTRPASASGRRRRRRRRTWSVVAVLLIVQQAAGAGGALLDHHSPRIAGGHRCHRSHLVKNHSLGGICRKGGSLLANVLYSDNQKSSIQYCTVVAVMSYYCRMCVGSCLQCLLRSFVRSLALALGNKMNAGCFTLSREEEEEEGKREEGAPTEKAVQKARLNVSPFQY